MDDPQQALNDWIASLHPDLPDVAAVIVDSQAEARSPSYSIPRSSTAAW
ncbi:hypothetical protein [Micromonospora sp. CB01531]|nr:hypothetical protein [Micromonospora sp. CB01531]